MIIFTVPLRGGIFNVENEDPEMFLKLHLYCPYTESDEPQVSGSHNQWKRIQTLENHSRMESKTREIQKCRPKQKYSSERRTKIQL